MLKQLAAAAFLLASLAGCASTGGGNPRDPIEPVNRVVFEFNDIVDRAAIKPVAQGYRAVLPSPVRSGVRNFFANLLDPWIGVNNLLQGKVESGLSDFSRFVFNSTFGIGGIFDIATDMGMPKHNEDFGQTLGVWGAPPGAYLVLPFLGPSSVRDAIGTAAGIYANVGLVYLRNSDIDHWVVWRNSAIALDVISNRADLLDTTDLIEEAALDRYAFVRDAFFQRRRNLIYDGNPPPEPAQSSTAPPSLETEFARESPGLPVEPPGGEVAASQRVEPRVPENYEAVLAAGDTPLAVTAVATAAVTAMVAASTGEH